MTRDDAMCIAREIFSSDVTERQMSDFVDFISALGLIKYRTKEDDAADILATQLENWSGLKNFHLPTSSIVGYIRSLGYKIVLK